MTNDKPVLMGDNDRMVNVRATSAMVRYYLFEISKISRVLAWRQVQSQLGSLPLSASIDRLLTTSMVSMINEPIL